MTTERRTLFDSVIDELERGRVPFALIGAAAMALCGVSRSTLDIDLLVTERRVLESSFWTGLSTTVECDIRSGGRDDPLAGVIRLRAADQRDVDVVVGRGTWDTEVVDRAEAVAYGGRRVPMARVEDLILLKLYAGGSQDRWDIEQLLAGSNRDALIEAVDNLVRKLPLDAQRFWKSMRADS